MELSELKTAWQQLDDKLGHQEALQLAILRERHVSNTRDRLKPLFWGMAVQIIFGIASIIIAAPFWIQHLAQPMLMLSGLIVHLYGIVLIALAGHIMLQINRLDMSAPVVRIQKRIFTLKKHYIRCGWIVGLPWWVLWLPYTVIFAHSRFGLFEQEIPLSFIVIGSACVVFMALTIGAVAWAKNPKRPQLAAKTEAMLAGVSLTRAQQSLDELQRFERED